MRKARKKEDKKDALITGDSLALTQSTIDKEEISIDDLHKDLEKKLEEQGFIFDKRKFIIQDEHWTLGERIADRVAKFGGSWYFIIIFGLFIMTWMFINIYLLVARPFDPYPFILLNLILSCLAAMQAPIIMMSQNRQAQKDRKQEEINIEKEILDFKQDRLDLILDQKEWDLLLSMDERLKKIERMVQHSRKNKKR
ncbi:MAG TPA: DUF1003 domain-containing protein [Candidatus Nanoarchaeia archaeon]|nr:DUF1003 domain-containing protein [Candidatus Nanoarchaeia archaeon]